ncbi:MAG: hypothetical protein KBC37_07275, partial [Thermotogae bacterium]|nr:hypothetical protein [Thermotogota bacterium]
MESQWHFAFPALNYIPKLEKYKKDVPVKLWGAIKKQGWNQSRDFSRRRDTFLRRAKGESRGPVGYPAITHLSI